MERGGRHPGSVVAGKLTLIFATLSLSSSSISLSSGEAGAVGVEMMLGCRGGEAMAARSLFRSRYLRVLGGCGMCAARSGMPFGAGGEGVEIKARLVVRERDSLDKLGRERPKHSAGHRKMELTEALRRKREGREKETSRGVVAFQAVDIGKVRETRQKVSKEQ